MGLSAYHIEGDNRLMKFVHPDTPREKLQQALYVALFGHMTMKQRLALLGDLEARGVIDVPAVVDTRAWKDDE